MSLVCLWPIGTFFVAEPCRGDSSDVPSVPQPVEWVTGPGNASLGSVAELRIPAGYRFADVKGAKSFLENAKSPVPNGLVGILAPDSGNWWVTLELSDTGYVRDDDQDRLDAAAILTAVSAQIQGKSERPGATTALDWELQPVYDPQAHSLEWATKSEGRTERDKVVRHVVRLLGRHGAVQAVTVQPRANFTELTPLKQVAKAVSFKAGEGYADYQKGDKVAVGGLTGMIASSSIADVATADDAESGGVKAFWIGLAVVGCAVAGAGLLLVRKLNQNKAQTSETVPGAAAAPVAPANGAPVFRAPKPKAAANGSKLRFKTNGSARSSNNQSSSRRRKVFDYPKFYTEMMLQGPSPVIGVENYNYNGQDSQNGNSSTNGHSSNGSKTDSVHAHISHSDLIASQRNFIEEQKRLIQEQARLIEEKSRLIAEKNQLLERQSQLIDNNLV